jgi:AraC-like DNA-binding protein
VFRYPIGVTDIYVNGQREMPPAESRRTDGGKLRLGASHNNLTFHLSDFSYTNPVYMIYQYKLEGKDKEWQIAVGKSDITYYDLASGNYVFRVRHVGDADASVELPVYIAYPVKVWSLIAVGIALLFVGYLLYQRKRNARNRHQSAASAKKSSEEKYKSSRFSEEDCKRLTEQLNKLMAEQKPYINPDLKLSDLAAMLNTSGHTLSYLFNQHLNINYYDYLNDYRIAEFKRLVAQQQSSLYTLSALAEQSGFSSRAAFFRYFKKATGITPNEYIKQANSHAPGKKEG